MEVETIKNKIRAITGISFEKQDWMRKMGKSIRKWWLMFLFIAIFAGLSYYIFSSVLQKDIRHITIEQSNLIQSWLLWFSILAAGFTLIYQKVTKEEDRDINNLAILEPQTLHNFLLFKHTPNPTIGKLGKIKQITKNEITTNFLLTKNLDNLYEWVFDIFTINIKDGAPFFILTNVGNGFAKPLGLYILYEKNLYDNKFFFNNEMENLSHFTYMNHNKTASNTAIYVYHKETYKELFNAIQKNLRNFLVIINYISIPGQKEVWQGYIAHIEDRKYGQNNQVRPFLTNFIPIPKQSIRKYISPNTNKKTKYLYNKLRHYPVFK